MPMTRTSTLLRSIVSIEVQLVATGTPPVAPAPAMRANSHIGHGERCCLGSWGKKRRRACLLILLAAMWARRQQDESKRRQQIARSRDCWRWESQDPAGEVIIVSRASRRRSSGVSFSTRSKGKRGHGGVDITGAGMGVPTHKLISAGEVPGSVDSRKGLAATGNALKLGIWRWTGPLPVDAEWATLHSIQPCQKY